MSEVAKCPKCGKSIDETHENSWCTNCGEPLPSAIKALLPKLAELAAASAATSKSAQADPALNWEPSPTSVSGRIAIRYRDAYRVGTALVGLGDAIKIGGAVIAALIVVLGLSAGGVVALAGVVFGVIGGGLFWLFGVVVAAQGQILRATLDSAVASSPFLTNDERLQAMGVGIPQPSQTRGGAQLSDGV